MRQFESWCNCWQVNLIFSIKWCICFCSSSERLFTYWLNNFLPQLVLLIPLLWGLYGWVRLHFGCKSYLRKYFYLDNFILSVLCSDKLHMFLLFHTIEGVLCYVGLWDDLRLFAGWNRWVCISVDWELRCISAVTIRDLSLGVQGLV